MRDLKDVRVAQGLEGAHDAMRKDDGVLLPSVIGATLIVLH